MSTNCLVKKLKGVINNDGLETLGILKIQFIPTINLTLKFDSNDFYVNFIGFTYSGQNKVKPSDSGLIFIDKNSVVATDEELYITMPKYKVLGITGNVVVDACRIWGDSITTLSLNSNSRITNAKRISDFIENLSTFIVNNAQLDSSFDVSKLGVTGQLKNFNLNTANCYGTMDNIGFSPLTNLAGEVRFPQTKDVTFVVEQFVANNVISGRTSGNITLFKYIGLCDAKFNDSPVAARSNDSIEWSESSGNTSITFNGASTTIHVNSNGTWTRVS